MAETTSAFFSAHYLYSIRVFSDIGTEGSRRVHGRSMFVKFKIVVFYLKLELWLSCCLNYLENAVRIRPASEFNSKTSRVYSWTTHCVPLTGILKDSWIRVRLDSRVCAWILLDTPGIHHDKRALKILGFYGFTMVYPMLEFSWIFLLCCSLL